MKFISIEKAMKKGEGKVSIRGWVFRIRKSNEFIFIILRDFSNIIQCVVERKKSPKLFKDAEKLTTESSLELEGNIRKEKRAITGYEVHVKKLNIINIAERFPITRDKSTEFLLDNRHLWLRSRYMNAILKIRSTVFGAIHEYFRKQGYYEFQSPTITSGAAEAGPTQFEVNYYGKKLFLTQTWQFYAEAAIYSLEKIYCVAPSFRAEKSKTARHLSEYWHAEVESAWLNLDQLINLGEGLIKHVIKKVLQENKKELAILNRDIQPLQIALKKKFPRITYDKALKLLKEKKKMTVPWGKDLRTIEEDKLMELFDTPVFVTHYPKEIMAFYKPRDPRNPKTARCFDCLLPEGYGELIGGSERDINIKELLSSLKRAGEKIENYSWYLDLNKYGAVPHAGFGLGVERFISWLCKLENIKDAIAFPRTMIRYKP